MKLKITLFFLLFSGGLFAQTVTLGTFDNFTGDCRIGQTVSPHPFVDGACNTRGWYASHGTPHLVRNQVDNSTRFIQTYDSAPDRPDCCSGEGIFREYDFDAGRTYLLSFRFYLPTIVHPQTGEVHFLNDLFVRLTNQLPVPPPFTGTPGNQYPTVTDAQVVLNIQDITATNEWVTLYASFTPTRNYSQIWFTGENRWDEAPNVHGYFYMDDVQLIENYTPQVTDGCCVENAFYSNTSSLPALTQVNNRIEAGPNVTVTSGQTVTFEAGNNILLKNGFRARSGSSFTATIQDCADPLTLGLDVNRSFCDVTIVPEICGGTGFYIYDWSTGSRTSSISLTPTSTVTYTLTVTDAGTGSTVTESVTVGRDPEFYGNFSVFVPNVFTPNGDGINDLWEVRDANVGTGPIKAYDYDLVIVNRAGTRVYNKKESNATGFNGGDIYWNGKNNSGSWMPSGVYYFSLVLKNCDHKSGELIKGTISLFGSQARPALETPDSEDIFTNVEIEDTFRFWPNPTSNFLRVDFGVSQDSYLHIDLISLEGKLIRKLEDNDRQQAGIYSKEYSFDYLPKGVYFIRFETSEHTSLQKVIIQ